MYITWKNLKILLKESQSENRANRVAVVEIDSSSEEADDPVPERRPRGRPPLRNRGRGRGRPPLHQNANKAEPRNEPVWVAIATRLEADERIPLGEITLQRNKHWVHPV